MVEHWVRYIIIIVKWMRDNGVYWKETKSKINNDLQWMDVRSGCILFNKRHDAFALLFKIIGLFCKRALQKRLYSTKQTYNFKQP